MASNNVDKVRAAHDNWNRRDYNACVREVTDNCTYEDHARGITLRGKQELIQYLQQWGQAWSDGRISDPKYIDAGNVVVCEFTGSGTNDGKFGDLPPTNRHAEFGFCEIWHFDNSGRMVAGDCYYDQLSILTQLGHLQTQKAA